MTSTPTPPQKNWPILESMNSIELLSYLGTSPLATKHTSDEIEWVITSVDDNTYNGIIRAHLSSSRINQVITDVTHQFRHHHIPHLWYLTPDSQPQELAQHLESHSWLPLTQGVGMAMDLSTLTNPFPPLKNLSLERVTDHQSMKQWIELQDFQLYNGDPDTTREPLYLSLGLTDNQPLRHYLAKLPNKPVGALSLFLGSQAAGLYNVKVHPDLQGQGIGTAMTHKALIEAQNQQYTVAVVAPTSESRSMYQKLGFILHREAIPCYRYQLETK